MDTKKLIGAMVAAFVILFVAGFLVHSVLLGPTYREMRDAGFSFRPEDAMRHKLWGIWVSDALYSILFVWAGGAEATRSTGWRILVLFKGAAVELLADPNLRTMQ